METTYTTRFGRQTRKPVLYTPPTEIVLVDDFNQSEYDSDDSDGDTINSESDRSETDLDDDGSDLEDFIVPDDSDSDEQEVAAAPVA